MEASLFIGAQVLTMSINYYNKNAQDFFSNTVNVDMTHVYNEFTKIIPKGGSILDAGCGSGRDTLAFINMGYKVTAFDASPVLAHLATNHTGIPIKSHKFLDLSDISTFDAVWACASLLHVSREELPINILKLSRTLKENGILYASFKEGNTTRMVNKRRFTDMTIQDLKQIIPHCELMSIKFWRSQDARKGRENEFWINMLAKKIIS